MDQNKGVVYRKTTDIVTRKIAGETLLVPVRGELADLQKVFVLQGIGEFIWQKIDGEQNQTSLSQDVLEMFDVERDTAETDLREFLHELVSAGLIEEIDQ